MAIHFKGHNKWHNVFNPFENPHIKTPVGASPSQDEVIYCITHGQFHKDENGMVILSKVGIESARRLIADLEELK